MNSITIAHTVDNPIQRKPVREDIYTKACQLRIINTPGSEIEDRQYEILFKNISIGTGNWKEILNFTQPSSVCNRLVGNVNCIHLTVFYSISDQFRIESSVRLEQPDPKAITEFKYDF